MGNWSLIIKMKVSFPQLVCAEIERETIADSETVLWKYQTGWNSLLTQIIINLFISQWYDNQYDCLYHHQHINHSLFRQAPAKSSKQGHRIMNSSQLLSNSTILNFIVLMGGGIGIFNMLGTQLGQLMCPAGPHRTIISGAFWKWNVWREVW